ncbi:hypothetical protein [Acaryochloris sp. IP29b_bin.148]|uniref:hypothetical protein n=1 Tax=Acaryochloris sp. IP29b_bin.148 TaxID=2969218 RepID=UPI0026227160|nr:hypothetical protein [Acaryochloris sp. IP29b_bin.148]
MSQQYTKSNPKQLISWTAPLLLLSILMTGCGPDLRSQCKKVQKAYFDGQKQGPLGTIDQAAMLKNAENYEKLSSTFQTLNVQDNTLKKSVKDLATAFKEVAAATRSRAQISDADGTTSFYANDTQGEQQYKSILAQEQRAYSKVQTSMEQVGIHCNLR